MARSRICSVMYSWIALGVVGTTKIVIALGRERCTWVLNEMKDALEGLC